MCLTRQTSTLNSNPNLTSDPNYCTVLKDHVILQLSACNYFGLTLKNAKKKKKKNTVMILNVQTDRPEQTLQNQIRLEQSTLFAILCALLRLITLL